MQAKNTRLRKKGFALLIRQVCKTDAAAIQAIYAPIVENTAISFEEVAPDIEEIATRIATISSNFPYLVAEEDDAVIGYAYASQHRVRAAYRHSVDVSVYIAKSGRRRGVGRQLYEKLLAELAAQRYHAAFAGIALPNEASVGLHQAMGFVPVGIYREVRCKFGKWHDVGWWQRHL